MRRGEFLKAAVAVSATAACRLYRETPEKHIVHKGERAVLHSDRGDLFVAASKAGVHALARAWETGQRGLAEQMQMEGKAFVAASGTAVEVITETFNEREIRILEGPHAGRKGWVPFEWLKPAR